ncbi:MULTISPECIES: hypothetical protein [Bacteria]|uniref:Uncharacterized protein n=1 Tax=Microbacterium phage Min1 TaxID=446529 RepID=A6N1Z3_9CAUD|nr:hypothetical protein MPMin1_gp35 [Microbacterium phage Min1]ABR10465.1 hypothetical protein [Microbacterium phage Min1]
MTSVGSIPMNVRLRIEAGIGHALTDVGHADIHINLPVEVTTLTDTETAGAAITSTISTRLTEAVAAFERTLKQTNTHR